MRTGHGRLVRSSPSFESSLSDPSLLLEGDSTISFLIFIIGNCLASHLLQSSKLYRKVSLQESNTSRQYSSSDLKASITSVATWEASNLATLAFSSVANIWSLALPSTPYTTRAHALTSLSDSLALATLAFASLRAALALVRSFSA